MNQPSLSTSEQLILDLWQAETPETRSQLLRARPVEVNADLVTTMLVLANDGSKKGENRTANDLITIAKEVAAYLRDEKLRADCLAHLGLLRFRESKLQEAAQTLEQA
jgi:hypothetical protein